MDIPKAQSFPPLRTEQVFHILEHRILWTSVSQKAHRAPPACERMQKPNITMPQLEFVNITQHVGNLAGTRQLTRAPFEASSSTVAAPMPLDPPVTKQVKPSNSIFAKIRVRSRLNTHAGIQSMLLACLPCIDKP